MSKRGLSTVVTTLILILLVLVAIGIIWVVIKNVLTESVDDILLDKFTVSMKIKNVEVDDSNNNLSVRVKRNPGQGDLIGIKFLFNDGEEVFDEEVILEELSEAGFSFISVNSSKVQTISIAPIYKSKSGKKIIGKVMDTYNIKRASQTCEQLGGTCCSSGYDCQGGSFQLSSDCGNNCCVGGTCVICTDTCSSLGYECGTQTVCGQPQDCGTCESGHNCVSGNCEIITNPCDLTSASWSQSSVTDGTLVTLTITGTGECTGEAITFDIYEDDPLFDDYVTSISDTYDSTTWTAHWTYSGDDDLGDDPRDYYFEATVDSNGDSITSANLEVASVTQPCDLTSASWSQSSVTDGTLVTLTITGTGECTGEAITFDIYEDDPLFDDYVTSISDTYDSTTWTAHWTYSGDDDLGDDPRDYYFEATVDSNGDSITSANLEVSRVPGTCSSEGGEVCETNYHCTQSYIPASDTTECCPAGNCELSSCAICTDCDLWYTTCSYSECHSCGGGPCYYKGNVIGNDCVELSSVCGSSVTTCEDYSNEECSNDPCGIGNCLFDGSSCITQVFPPSYAIRSFSQSTVAPNQDVIITLDVYIDVDLETDENGSAFAIIVEDLNPLISSGWTIVHNGYGTLSEGELGWAFTSTNPYDLLDPYYAISYTLRAPSSTGNYNFDGDYIFPSTDADGDTTLGSTTVTVI
jgi:hypothetical protein